MCKDNVHKQCVKHIILFVLNQRIHYVIYLSDIIIIENVQCELILNVPLSKTVNILLYFLNFFAEEMRFHLSCLFVHYELYE